MARAATSSRRGLATSLQSAGRSCGTEAGRPNVLSPLRLPPRIPPMTHFSGTRRSSMRKVLNPWLAAAIISLLSAAFLRGQTAPPAAAGTPLPDGRGSVAAAGGVAAGVDGESIPEIAVQRALKRVPPARQAEARPEILNFLIENALIDHYLAKIPVVVEPKEIEAKMTLIKAEIKKENSSLEKVMQDLLLN